MGRSSIYPLGAKNGLGLPEKCTNFNDFHFCDVCEQE
jgi:hypothetical protein